MTASARIVERAAVRVAQREQPVAGGVVPGRTRHLGTEADVLADPVAIDAALEVVVQLVALREVLAPVRVHVERVRVEVARDVDAAPGIAVLEPGAADGVVLLDHRERDAGLVQADGGQDAGHARADHDDPVQGGLLAQRDPASQ